MLLRRWRARMTSTALREKRRRLSARISRDYQQRLRVIPRSLSLPLPLALPVPLPLTLPVVPCKTHTRPSSWNESRSSAWPRPDSHARTRRTLLRRSVRGQGERSARPGHTESCTQLCLCSLHHGNFRCLSSCRDGCCGQEVVARQGCRAMGASRVVEAQIRSVPLEGARAARMLFVQMAGRDIRRA